MKNPKTLVSVSYLSILFAPVIVPLFIYFSTKNEMVKSHSKRAMISHLVPIVFSIILSLLSFLGFLATSFEKITVFLFFVMIVIALYLVLYFVLIVWNIVQAIRAFKTL